MITEEPGDTPEAMPEDTPIVATPVVALVQLPPDVELLNVVVNP